MRMTSIKRIWRSLQYRYYKRFKYKNEEHYKKLVDSNCREAIDIKWVLTYGKKFPWDNPVTLNEKITWLSGMTDTTLWTEYSDKYAVRSHIQDFGLGHILTKCYGIWDKVEDIDYDKLPDSFVIKCTHDCGSTVIIKDKKEVNLKEINSFLDFHLKSKMGYRTCEPHYTRILPRIMAEELIPLKDDGFSTTLVDYKIWCLNGKATFAFICYDRHLDSDKKGGHTVYDLYDINDWKPIRQYITDEYKGVTFKDVPKPKNWELMVEYAEKLASGFPEVRIDLYNVNGKIYFGEMTFTSQGGRMSYWTQEFQEMMGKLVDISKCKKETI